MKTWRDNPNIWATPAADWRGQWDDFGRQTDRMDYLRRHFPSLVARIEAEAVAAIKR